VERIGDDVRLVLRRFGTAEGMERIVRAWPAAVGPAVAENAWPARLARDGTLHVATRSSTWAFELTHLEAEIRRKLDVALGEAAPPRLRFAPGRLPERGRGEVADVRPTPTPPTAGERAEAAVLAATIDDEDLRALVARAAAASLARAGSTRRL
jgi:hypothetical protein